VPVLHQCPRPCVEASTPSTIHLDGGAPDGSNGGLAARNPLPSPPHWPGAPEPHGARGRRAGGGGAAFRSACGGRLAGGGPGPGIFGYGLTPLLLLQQHSVTVASSRTARELWLRAGSCQHCKGRPGAAAAQTDGPGRRAPWVPAAIRVPAGLGDVGRAARRAFDLGLCIFLNSAALYMTTDKDIAYA
jgi:hypothetical protein